MKPNPFESPATINHDARILAEGPANPLFMRIIAVGMPIVVLMAWAYMYWTENPSLIQYFKSPLRPWGWFLHIGWILISFACVKVFFDRTRVYAGHIESLLFFPWYVEFQQIAYVQLTKWPTRLQIVKQDGQIVIISGGNGALLRAFEEIAARFPPPS